MSKKTVRDEMREISSTLRDECVDELNKLVDRGAVWSRAPAVSTDDGTHLGGVVFIADPDLYFTVEGFITNLLATAQSRVEKDLKDPETVH